MSETANPRLSNAKDSPSQEGKAQAQKFRTHYLAPLSRCLVICDARHAYSLNLPLLCLYKRKLSEQFHLALAQRSLKSLKRREAQKGEGSARSVARAARVWAEHLPAGASYGLSISPRSLGRGNTGSEVFSPNLKLAPPLHLIYLQLVPHSVSPGVHKRVG